MFRLLIVCVVFVALITGGASAQISNPETKSFEMAARIQLPGGFSIRIPGKPPGRKRSRRETQKQAPSGWQPISPDYGRGSIICNTANEHFSCFAFRCGKGRGLEFAFIFNVGEYERMQPGRIDIDGNHVDTIEFTAIDQGGELVAPYLANTHAQLLKKISSGRAMTLDIGYTHNFSLRGSSNQIKQTLALCANEIENRQPNIAALPSANRAISVGQSVKRLQEKYQPATEAFDYGSLPRPDRILAPPRYRSVKLTTFGSEAIPTTDDGVFRPVYSLVSNATFVKPHTRIFFSKEHQELVSDFYTARQRDPTLFAERADFERRFSALLADAKSRYGENHPAVAVVLENFAEFSLQMKAYASQDWQQSNVERAALYRQIAEAWMQASLSGEQKNTVGEHTMSAWLAFGREAIGDDLRVECSEAVPKSEVAEAYRTVAAIDHTLNGPRLEQLGWLNAAAACIEDHDDYLEYMKVRVTVAHSLSEPQAIARTVSDLARAYFLVGEPEKARSAYREAFRVHIQNAANDGIDTTFVTDVFGNVQQPSHITILGQLGLNAELDYYLAGIVQDYLDNSDFATRIGADFARGVSRVLEKAGRTELADQYYAYLGAPLDLMVRFGKAWLDSDRYDDGQLILERALQLAETRGERRTMAAVLPLLARMYEETGDLESGVQFARRALLMAKSGGVELHSTEIDALNRLVRLAEQEQGNLDRVAENLASDLEDRLAKVCETGENPFAVVGYFPTRILLTDPVIADTFLGQPAVREYIECFNRLRGGLPGYGRQKATVIASESIGDILLLLGLLNEADAAQEVLSYLFDTKNWRFLSSSPTELVAQQNGVVTAYQMAIRGVRLAGKAEWIEPYLAKLPLVLDEQYVRLRHENWAGLGEEALGLGIELLDIGQIDRAQALFALDEKFSHEPDTDSVSCVVVAECEYRALMYEKADQPAVADRYYSAIPNLFVMENTGANVSAWEADELTKQAIEEGFFHELAGHYRLAEIYFEIAVGDSFKARHERKALATLDDIEISASVSRLTFEKGEVEKARIITNELIDAAREKFGGNTAYSSDSLIRWSHRLRTIFEVQLDSAPSNSNGEISADENDYFAMQFLVTTPIASTIAKMADRAAREGGEILRQHQDLSRRLSALYSQLALAQAGRADALLAEIKELEEKEASVKARIEDTAGDYASFIGMQFPTLGEVQEQLDSDSALLISFVGRNSAYLWIITGENSRLRRLPQTPEAIETTIRRLRGEISDYLETNTAELENRQWQLAAFHEPYREFLQDFELELKVTKHLYFLPNGPFDGLPLPVLLRREPPTDRMTAPQIRAARLPWLIRDISVSILPSIHALKALSAARPKASGQRRPFLGIGDPDFGEGIRISAVASRTLPSQLIAIPPLPETAEAVTRIAEILNADLSRDLLLGENASETRLRSLDLTPYKIINFATHGILAGELQGIGEPALILAVPRQQTATDNGLLTTSDVTTLNLNADLVILSACNTAASDGRPGAEGLSGLANAFFYAGARTLVVTHWEIPSKPAVELVAGMVAAVEESDKLSWPEALQRSAISLIDEVGPASFAHPAAWGAYIVVGANSPGLE
jgi:CHAT domain-containing protein/tetratricopeptide (TPR) repeat protein